MAPKWRLDGKAHLIKMASAENVTVEFSRPRWEAEASLPISTIFIPRKWIAPVDALISMHELGHLLDPVSKEHYYATDLSGSAIREASAWAWAVENVHSEVLGAATSQDWNMIGVAWSSYLR